MAIRIDADGDSIQRTTNLPTITGFTIMAWVRIRAAVAGAAIFSFGDGTGSNDFYDIELGGAGNLVPVNWNGNAGSSNGTALVVDTPVHLALTCAGTGAGQLLTYQNGTLDITFDGFADVDAVHMELGDRIDGGNDSNLALSDIKIYDAVLTAAEIRNEMRTKVPRRFANLNGWYPCYAGATERLKDYSGAGNNWTANGTLGDEPLPVGVSWNGMEALVAAQAAGAAAAAASGPLVNGGLINNSLAYGHSLVNG